MRYYLLLWSVVYVGCGWSPERGNPYDPNSDRYIPPPVLNRPPFVERPSVTTQCVNNLTIDQCGFLIKARIQDLDNNLRLDSIVALVDGRFLGHLTNSADDTVWFLSREETELDSATQKYVGAWVTVVATDDSGATHRDSVEFPSLYREYPTLSYPEELPDCVCPDFHTFSWRSWNGEGQPDSVELRFYFLNLNVVPPLTITRHFSPADTSFEAPLNFETADNNSFIFYGWRLFVRDQSGSVAGSLSGTFRAFVQCPQGGCGQ